MDIDYSLLGKRVKILRKDLHMTQEILAERAGISNQYLSNIENSRSIPSLETIVALCRALQATPNDILLGIDTASEDYLISDLFFRLRQCSPSEKRLLYGFLDVLEQERNALL